MPKKLSAQVIDELCMCDKNHYCSAREFLKMSASFEPRWVIQSKCVEMYKWFVGERLNIDVGWSEAHLEWIDSGFANVFGDIWKEMESANEEITPTVIYERIMKRTKNLEKHE